MFDTIKRRKDGLPKYTNGLPETHHPREFYSAIPNPGIDDIVALANSDYHDGMLLLGRNGLLRRGARFRYSDEGVVVTGLIDAAAHGYADVGGTGSDAGAHYARVTGEPAVLVRGSRKPYVLLFTPDIVDGRLVARTHVVTEDGAPPPTGERRHAIQPMPRPDVISLDAHRNTRTPHSYAA